MRLYSAVSLALVACTSTHTVTITVPPHATRPMTPDEASCVAASGACANVVVQNDMSSSFALDQSVALIDGQSGMGLVPLAPGAHDLLVDVSFHFVSTCIYCYVRAYKFRVRSRHTFTVAKGTTLEIHAIAYEKGGVTTPIEDRPAMRFVETVRP